MKLPVYLLRRTAAVRPCKGLKGRPGVAQCKKVSKTAEKQAFFPFCRFTSFAAFRMMITNREHRHASEPYKYRGLVHVPRSHNR
jgi:hypothetical protein